jgi:hypothetical protein
MVMNIAMHNAIHSGNVASNNARHAAMVDKCKYVINNYDSTTATIGDMRQYSSCVYMIHGSGNQPSENEVLIIKAGITTLLIFMAIGAYLNKDDELPFIFLGALGGLLAWIASAFVVWLVCVLVML